MPSRRSRRRRVRPSPVRSSIRTARRIPAGQVPDYDEVETIFAAVFVEGVVGDIPKS
jgi:hypothetical protein